MALEGIVAISIALQKELRSDARFFIKGGAATQLLLDKPLEAGADIDTYLLINPSASNFEELRAKAIKTCLSVLQKKFKPQLLEYGEETDETLAAIQTNTCCAPLRIVDPPNGNIYQIFVYANLRTRDGTSYPLTLITVKHFIKTNAGHTRPAVLLDIIIPKRDYPLLEFHWDTIKSVNIIKGGVVLPVMDPVSLYVNQAYATARTAPNNAKKEKRATRANAVLNLIRSKGVATRKAYRKSKAALLTTNRNVFDAILETLPANVEAAPAGAAGAGGAGATAAATTTPLPLLPSSPPRNSTRRNEKNRGTRFTALPRFDEFPVYSPLTKKTVYLRRYKNGLKDEIYNSSDPSIRKRLLQITYKPVYNQFSELFYEVYLDGKYHTTIRPGGDEYFDPILLRSVRR